jgi:hypothetical protein
MVLALVAFGLIAEAAKIKVRAESDPEFQFDSIHTWAWDEDAGQVIMARLATDDPAPLKARIDPLIRRHVAAAMEQKGLTAAATGTPDVWLHYYALVTINTSGQQMGQFLPSVPYWGLPPFPPATTSLNMVTKGSMVLDAMLPGKAGERHVVWRGVAQSTVADDDSPAEREARLRDASAELVKRFPVKKGK